MKKELNRAILSIPNVREVEFFREMARQFNYNTLARATCVEEAHKQYHYYFNNKSDEDAAKQIEKAISY